MTYPDGFSDWTLDKRNEYFIQETRAYDERKRSDGRAPKTSVINFVSAASLAGRIPPDRPFVVQGLIPNREVTLLSGNGGDGKSLLVAQLAVSVSARTPWLGINVTSGRVVFLSAEDELDEVHRRLLAICDAEGVDMADLDGLQVVPLAGMVATMAEEGKAGSLASTPLWAEFAERIEQIGPALVILDNSADLFAGNEISRVHVRQFIAQLRGLAFKVDCAILLLSHPSVAGMTNGSGISGSTAWNNTVRSRLYLTRPIVAEGEFTDPDVRVLQSKKANYGPLSEEIRLRWQDGRFVNESTAPFGRLDRAIVEAKAEAVFLNLLQQLAAEGRDVSANPSRSYAPAVFASHPDAASVPKRSLEAAMNRLLKLGRIRVETTGSASRRRSRLIFDPLKDEK